MATKLLNRNFILLWLGQAVSQLGNGAGIIATMWWVQTTTGSALALGTLAAVKALVSVLLSPVAGVIVDRFSRKAIIVAADVIRGVIYVVFAHYAFQGTLTLSILYIGSAISSACGAFFTPAIGASIPLLVPQSKLQQANSLRGMTDQLATIFSYALGGVLVALLGVPLLLLLDGVSFILSGISEAFIFIPRATEKARMTVKLMLNDLRAGVTYAQGNRVLFRMLQVLVFVNFCFVPFFLLLPKYVAEHLGAGSEVYGYITSAQMAGMLIGTCIVLFTSVIKRHFWVVKWGIAIQAAGFIVAPLLPASAWGLQLVVYGLFGVLNSVINIVFFTALQRKVKQEYMGKILALVNAMVLAAQPVASALSGLLADQISIVAIFIGAALLGVLSNIRLLSIPGYMSFFVEEDREIMRPAANQ